MHNLIILLLFIIFFLIMLYKGIKMKTEKKDFLGIPPINSILYFIGKTSMGLSWAFLFAQAAKLNVASVKLPSYLLWFATLLFVLGIIFSILSYYHLGMSDRFGLPKEKTTFRTKGLYRISRNPMYLGFYLISIASCMYALNPFNLFFSLLGIAVHHKIILAEENFLEQRFKDKWLKYKANVRRYI